jgi:hypothetical protein
MAKARYGAEHVRRRRLWRPRVLAGKVKCWRCGLPIEPFVDAAELGISPAQTWDLGHDDENPAIWKGPEHARKTSKHPACNRATKARVVARARRQKGKHPGLR